MRIVSLSRERLVEMEQVFCEAIGVAPKGVDDDALWSYFDAERSWLALDDDGRVAGLASGFGTRLALPGGRVVAGGGVPWVGVRVDRHGGGVGRALLEHQVADAVGRGDAFLALNSSQYPIYGRYGYGPTGRWWSIRIDARRVRWREGAPIAGRVTVGHGPDVRERLVDCHERAFGAWPGEIARHAGHWTRRLAPRAAGEGRRLWALSEDASGAVVAAAHYTVEQRFDDTGFANRLEVDDLFGVDEASQVALWRWLLGRNLVGEVSCLRADPGSALPDALHDPRLLVTTELADTTWLRILDVGRVLGARATLAAGSVVLRVLDPLVARVAGHWRVDGDGERLAVRRTDDASDVTLGIDLLASLVFAHAGARRLAAAGRLTGSPAALETLDRLLAWPCPAWSSHRF